MYPIVRDCGAVLVLKIDYSVSINQACLSFPNQNPLDILRVKDINPSRTISIVTDKDSFSPLELNYHIAQIVYLHSRYYDNIPSFK